MQFLDWSLLILVLEGYVMGQWEVGTELPTCSKRLGWAIKDMDSEERSCTVQRRRLIWLKPERKMLHQSRCKVMRSWIRVLSRWVDGKVVLLSCYAGKTSVRQQRKDSVKDNTQATGLNARKANSIHIIWASAYWTMFILKGKRGLPVLAWNK